MSQGEDFSPVERSPFDLVLEDAIKSALNKEDVSQVVDHLRQDPSASRAVIGEIIDGCGADFAKAKGLITEIVESLAQSLHN